MIKDIRKRSIKSTTRNLNLRKERSRRLKITRLCYADEWWWTQKPTTFNSERRCFAELEKKGSKVIGHDRVVVNVGH